MYGIGKETLGDNFKEFILFNKKYLSRGIKQFPGIADSEISGPFLLLTGKTLSPLVYRLLVLENREDSKK